MDKRTFASDFRDPDDDFDEVSRQYIILEPDDEYLGIDLDLNGGDVQLVESMDDIPQAMPLVCTKTVSQLVRERIFLPDYDPINHWSIEFDDIIDTDFANGDQPFLVFFFNLNGELLMEFETPKGFDREIAYFFQMGIEKGIKITGRNFQRLVQFGNVAGGAIENLLRSMLLIYSPALSSSQNWPASIRNDFVLQLQRFMSSLTDMRWKLNNKTVLYTPEINKESTIEELAQDKESVSRLEIIAVHWTRQIKVLLNSQNAAENSDSNGPLDEIEFWRNRCEDLTGVSKQLDKDVIVEVTDILKTAKSSYVNAFVQLSDEIKFYTQQAQDNLKFLNAIKETCHLINESRPKEISPVLPRIINAIRMIWLNSGHYNTVPLITNLYRKLSNEIIQRCCSVISLDNIFDGKVVSSIASLKHCLTCCEQYQTIYDKIQSMHAKHSPHPWNIPRNSVFAQINAFIQRCTDMLEICEAQKDFGRFEEGEKATKPIFPGSSGRDIELLLDTIEQMFTKLINNLREKKASILDVKATSWHDDYNHFRSGIKDLEIMMQNAINTAFETVTSVQQGVEILDIFAHLQHRESIKRTIDYKAHELVNRFVDCMNQVKKEMTQRVYLGMPLPTDPHFAGQGINWRFLRRRMEKVLMNLDQAFFLPLDATGIAEHRHQAALTTSALEDLTRKTFIDFQATIGMEPLKCLEWCVITKSMWQPGLIERNFSSQVLKLLNELHYWIRLGFEVPSVVVETYRRRSELRYLIETVMIVVRDYNHIMNLLSPDERALFRERITMLDKRIAPGFTKIHWTVKALVDMFVTDCRVESSKLQTRVEEYQMSNNRIKQDCEAIAKTLLIKFEPNRVYENNEYNETQNDHRDKTREKLIDIHREVINQMNEVKDVFVSDSPDIQQAWEKHTDKMDRYCAEAFRLNVKLSLTQLNRIINGDGRNDPDPLFKVALTLTDDVLVFLPPLPDLINIVGSMGTRFIECVSVIPRLQTILTKTPSERPPIHEVVANDDEIVRLQSVIRKGMKDIVSAVEDPLSYWDQFREIWELPKDDFICRYRELNPHVSSIDADIARYTEVTNKVLDAETMVTTRFLQLDFSLLKNAISAHCRDWQNRLTQLLLGMTTDLLNSIYTYCESMQEKLETHPQTLDQLGEMIELVEQVSSERGIIESKFSPLEEQFAILDKCEVTFSDRVATRRMNLANDWVKFQNSIVAAEQIIKKSKERFKGNLLSDMEEFKRSVCATLAELQANGPYGVELDPDEALAVVQDYRNRVEEFKTHEIELRRGLNIFKIEQPPCKEIGMIEKDLDLIELIWTMNREWESNWESWKIGRFADLKTYQMENLANNTFKKFTKLSRELRDRNWPIVENTRLRVDQFRRTMPLITDLRNPAMRGRHWDRIKMIIDKEFDQSSDQFTLEQIVELGFEQHADVVNEVSGAASKELAIEHTLDKIEHFWQNHELDMIQARDKPTYKIRTTDDLFQAIEEHQIQLSTMKTSRFVKPFEHTVDRWERALSLILETLEQMLQVQRQYIYMETIFIGEDIRKQLPKESTAFDNISASWQYITGFLHETRNTRECAVKPGLLETLTKLIASLEDIQQSLDMYMETKRQLFPRFYFLANDDLLEILGQSRNPDAVMPHLKKCFDNINYLKLEKVHVRVDGHHRAGNPYAVKAGQARRGHDQTAVHQRSNNMVVNNSSITTAVDDADAGERRTNIELLMTENGIADQVGEEQQRQPSTVTTNGSVDHPSDSKEYEEEDASAYKLVKTSNSILEEDDQLQITAESSMESRMASERKSATIRESILTDKSGMLTMPNKSTGIVLSTSASTQPTTTTKTKSQGMKVINDALAMISLDGEEVAFKSKVRLDGPVESWLKDVEQQMYRTLQSLLRECKTALKSVAKREKFVRDWPGQLCLTASQIQWTSDVTRALLLVNQRQDKRPLKSLRRKQKGILERFSEAIRSNLTKIQRLKVNALVVIEVHQRDIVDKLYKSGCSDVNAFDWLSQLRFYWDKDLDNCFVRQTNTSFRYGYEYLGNSGRLVITPLTDRCYITLTTALHLHRGGSPKGPAGTGKTETVKDLGKALGDYVIVVNCSEGLDFKSMGRMFVGLAQTGAWGCFDEFNRINIEVLSVVAQQILSILTALATASQLPVPAEKTRFMFEGRMLTLIWSCGIFITMNPGYAGRTELPDNLKSMFRPIAMVVPDSSMIAEITLFAEGFSSTKLLAKKVFTLYSLTVQQLSKQDHYDFGLRALVSVLRYAGRKKRANPQMPDDELLVLSLNDMNLAKLTSVDTPLFKAIMMDLFPGVEVAVLAYEDMKQAILENCKSMNLQNIPYINEKVIQLYETKCSRHSVMIVGQTLSGKSTTWRLLQNTYNTLAQKGVASGAVPWVKVLDYPLNPKSLSLGELYGEFNLATNEWRDGVLSSLMRQACADMSASQKWLVFDGPVDTLWIESMNSVMDDNKILTLINGERISMPEQVTLLFESGDLSQASPATVSRCGMVYNDVNALGWWPYVDSWLAGKSEKTLVDELRQSFERFVNPLYQFVRLQCSTIIPISVTNIIISLCTLLDVLIVPEMWVDLTDTENVPRQIEMTFLFCLIWTFGGVVDEIGRRKVDAYLREIETVFPSKDSIYEYTVDPKLKSWVHWDSQLKSNYTISSEIPFYKILVPTVDTVRYYFLTNLLVARNRPILLLGPVGTGKTSVAIDLINGLDSESWTNLTINMSAQTSSNNVQDIIESRVEKRTKDTFVPLAGTKLLIFLDDLNMPAKDTFGSQPPLELLRQWIDYKFWYDRNKQTMRRIIKTQLMAAMGPPGGGRMEISKRFQSRFHQIVISFPTIFQGLRRATRSQIETRNSMLRLWIHEDMRVFADRLVNDKDSVSFVELVGDALADHFDQTFHALCPGKQSPIFTDLIHQDALYEDVTDLERLRAYMNRTMKEYNETPGMIQLDLVLFRDAIEHTCKITRVVTQPRCNMLLIGIGGSGRQSLSKLAAYMCEYQAFQVEITKHYRKQEFREDLKRMYHQTGVQNKPTLFLFTDAQVVEESFLEDINNMLSSGEIPNLFKMEEAEEIRQALLEEAAQEGIEDVPQTMFRYFIERVRANLHVVLCMSPIGEPFRNRIRMYPAFVNCTTIDWFSEWPRQALFEVANKYLSEVQFIEDEPDILMLFEDSIRRPNLGTLILRSFNAPSPNTQATMRASVAEIFASMHGSVSQMASVMLAELRRHNYVTPTNYLQLVTGYKKHLYHKRSLLKDKANKLKNGLLKIDETREKVEFMSEELEVTKKKVVAFQKECDDYLIIIVQQKREADEQAKAVMQTQERIKVDEVKCKHMAELAQADLAQAMPALEAAMQALEALNKKDITEIKSYGKPPYLVQKVMEAVMILRGAEPTWAESKRHLSEQDFIKQLINFDRDNISDRTLKKISQYCAQDDFQPDVVGKVSAAARSLCMWVRAMEVYARIYRVVEPKRQRLHQAESVLAEKQQQLATAQAKLDEVMAEMHRLQQEYNEKMEQKEELRLKAEHTEKMLDRANKLVTGLAGERVRWEATVADLTERIHWLPGDCLMAAGFLSYMGPFLSDYRERLVTKWLELIKAGNVPASNPFLFIDFLADPTQIREWNLQGLPRDDFSVENGVIITRGVRWPLMIDPQGQAQRWIKAMEGKALLVFDMQTSDYMRILERAVQFGKPVLLQNIQEQLDQGLDPILHKSLSRVGGALIMRLGDKEVEYNNDFRFYITTKLPNPHYAPEISSKATIVNFAVKQQGLEGQLLGIVVRKERPELEEQKDNLVVSIATGKRRLTELEDEILRLLNEAQGSLLDDEQLVNTLQTSKVTSTEVTEQLQVAEKTEIQIDAAREGYRPCAQRAAILFFVLNDLARIDPMYQFALDAYLDLFNLSIEKSPRASKLDDRILNLNDYHTYAVYRYTCRGLFERHKLLFSFHICVKILEAAGKLDANEYTFLLRGGVVLDRVNQFDNPCPGWITEQNWDNITELEKLASFHGIVSSFEQYPREWNIWFTGSEPEVSPMPGEWDTVINDFQRMLIIRSLRQDRVAFCATGFIIDNLGNRFVEPPVLEIKQVLDDSSTRTPLIFVLSTGVDPTSALLQLADTCGMSKKFNALSLGQGQEPIANRLIREAIKQGNWVFLANCHLSLSWMPELDKIIEKLSREETHPEFRLWLSSTPNPKFPISILQAGIKMTTEPPKGLRSNMKRLYYLIKEDQFTACHKPEKYKKLLFSLCFFHSILIERRKFGMLGWNIPYEFNDSDFEVSELLLTNYLDQYEDTPWEALRYLIADINYGGHVTDDWDRRLLNTHIGEYFKDDALNEPLFKLSVLPHYYIPRDTALNTYRDFVSMLPQIDHPEVFGQHPNADVASQIGETHMMFDTLLSLRPQVSSASGVSREEHVLELIENLISSLPEDIDYEGTAKLLLADESPLTVVLLQEIQRYNLMLGLIRKQLNDLSKGIQGLVVMSSELEEVFSAIHDGHVPIQWGRTYSSLKPLGSWSRDLIARIDLFAVWARTAHPPKAFAIGWFIFPTGFLTAVLQASARLNNVAVDTLSWEFGVQSVSDVGMLPKVKEGVYISHLFLQGAGWDKKAGCLVEATPMQLVYPMPIIHYKPVENKKKTPKSVYIAPCYYYSNRAGTSDRPSFMLGVELKTGEKSPEHWTKRSTALLMNLDN